MMRCPSCKAENKDNIKNCKKCGTLLNVQPMWAPTWQWHAKALGGIYVGLVFVYFALNYLLGPYLRDIPKDVTPWLPQAQEIHK